MYILCKLYAYSWVWAWYNFNVKKASTVHIKNEVSVTVFDIVNTPVFAVTICQARTDCYGHLLNNHAKRFHTPYAVECMPISCRPKSYHQSCVKFMPVL